VALCADESSLTPAQIRRLDEIARDLGVYAEPGTSPCTALADALADEWLQAVESLDLLTAREARRAGAAAVVPGTSLFFGDAPLPVPAASWDRAAPPRAEPNPFLFGPSDQNDAHALGIVNVPLDWPFGDVDGGDDPQRDVPVPLGWSDLPAEMRQLVTRAVFDADPRAALRLYATGSEGVQAFAGQTHPVLTVDADGALVESTMPLIDYARLTTALGVRDPLDLFLAAASCTIKAYVNWMIANDARDKTLRSDFPREHNTIDRLAGDRDAFDYAGALDGGVPLERLYAMRLFSMTLHRSYITPSGTSMTLGDFISAVSGPLVDDPSEAARQWYRFVIDRAGAHDLTPLARRSGLLFGSRALDGMSVLDSRDLVHTGVPLGVFDRNPLGFVERAKRAARVPRGLVESWLGEAASREMSVWLFPGLNSALRSAAISSVRNAVANDRAPVTALLDWVQESIEPYTSAGVCTALYGQGIEAIAPFARLFAPSRAWIEPQDDDHMWVYLDLSSSAIEDALAMRNRRA
jgi:hypothetical protein